MAPSDGDNSGESLEDLVERLGEAEVQRVLLEAGLRYDSVARSIRLAAAAPDGRVGSLRSALDELKTRGHLGWRESNAWAHDAAPLVDEIVAEARSAPSRELLKFVQLAIGRVTKLIFRADDSSGMIGSLVGRLLEAHEQICGAGVADPKALARWMIRFGLDDQDFFTLDPVGYSDALGESGLALLRQEVEVRSSGPRPAFAVGYTMERLAVLDRDLDKIVKLHGGDLDSAYRFQKVVDAMLELGKTDEALAWAQRGISSTEGRQVAKLYDRAVQILEDRDDHAGQLALRKQQHERLPTATSYAHLGALARASGSWGDEVASARAVLLESDLGGFVDAMLADDDVEEAWVAANSPGGGHLDDGRWERLAEAHEPDDPGAALDVYLRLIDGTLVTADRRNYRSAAEQLKRARRVAAAADRKEQFVSYLAALREQYGRRPTLMAILDKAGLR